MKQPARRGRKRDPAAQFAILAATRELMLEVGYHRLSIEGVARRAGVGKATIYRWWPTKGSLVLEASAEHIAIREVTDSGETRTDLREAVQALIDVFVDPIARIVICAATAGLDDDPGMAAGFRSQTVYPWRQSATVAIQRGIGRGDLRADLDVALALDVLVGTVFQRTLVIATPAVIGLADMVADLILRM
jgi:AcrR family transcriptional regulator